MGDQPEFRIAATAMQKNMEFLSVSTDCALLLLALGGTRAASTATYWNDKYLLWSSSIKTSAEAVSKTYEDIFNGNNKNLWYSPRNAR